ncbi:hypothetical protein V497_06511 [Pseudogymnoascus sp. VKM F-4516 (FW-969)]|nr:hypothetical protein V497_06511 [Pseudogymnoascus sp. VKM F-4516 (FW-969)]
MTSITICDADDVCPQIQSDIELLLTPFEAKQKLADALKLLDAVSTSTYSRELFDSIIRQRIESIYRKEVQFAPYTLLHEPQFKLKEDDIIKLSPYCHKLEALAGFDDVLRGLEARRDYEKLLVSTRRRSKGQLIDSIVYSGLPKIIRNSVASVLDVIGSLALLRIRDIEARARANLQQHTFVTTEDQGYAAEEMWKCLRIYNSTAEKKWLDERLKVGGRWNKFTENSSVGIIVALCKLPPSLKPQFVKLLPIVGSIPNVLDRAMKATPCVAELLELRLSPWGATLGTSAPTGQTKTSSREYSRLLVPFSTYWAHSYCADDTSLPVDSRSIGNAFEGGTEAVAPSYDDNSMLALSTAAELHKSRSTELPLPGSLSTSIQSEGLLTVSPQPYEQLGVSTNVLSGGCDRAIVSSPSRKRRKPNTKFGAAQKTGPSAISTQRVIGASQQLGGTVGDDPMRGCPGEPPVIACLRTPILIPLDNLERLNVGSRCDDLVTGRRTFEANHEQDCSLANRFYPPSTTNEHEYAPPNLEYPATTFNRVNFASYAAPNLEYPTTTFNPVNFASYAAPNLECSPTIYPVNFASYAAPNPEHSNYIPSNQF